MGIPENVSQQKRAAGESLILDPAITQVGLLMTINDHGQTASVSENTSEVKLLQEQVDILTEQTGEGQSCIRSQIKSRWTY